MHHATAARMYDYYLGGRHNFEGDRAAADRVIASMPLVPVMARANRAFLARAVRYLVGEGVRQFLDIGSGIPTEGNVHEIAQRAAPDARVVYVDIDPVAVMQGRDLLDGNERAAATLGDITRPRELLDLLDDGPLHDVLDLDQPTALILAAVLHFVPSDAEAFGAVAQFRDRLVPSSWLVISHAATEGFGAEQVKVVQDVYRTQTATPGGLRTAEQVAAFFGDDFELVHPGLTWVPQWRPEPGDPQHFVHRPERSGVLGGVGRKIR